MDEDMGEKELQRKTTRKDAKRIIKLAKKHPDWYTVEEVRYVKLLRKSLKKTKNARSETGDSHSRSGEDDGVRSESEQPQESRQPKNFWITKLLHQARSLVGL